MASPHVVGVAALIWSHHPELKNTDIRQALEATALDLGDPGRDDYFGHGLINASAAVEYLNVSVYFINVWPLVVWAIGPYYARADHQNASSIAPNFSFLFISRI